MAEFHKPEVEVQVVRALFTSVIIDTGDDISDNNNNDIKLHGLTVPEKMKGNVLVILKIEDGYIKEHNAKCKESDKIHVFDRIFSVKGTQGSAVKLKGLLDAKVSGKV